jgi:hypothetical protein
VANCTKERLEKYPEYLDYNWIEIYDQYKKFNVERIFPFIDRTFQIPNYLRTCVYTPLPNLDPNFKKTFEEICHERIAELLATDKKLNLFWSGGLDSTTLLALFLDYKEKITVHLNYNSILESGYMFDTFVKPNFKYTIGVSTAYSMWNENELYLTGDPANHLHTIPSIKSYENFIPGIDLFDKENIHKLNDPYYKHIEEDKIEFYKPALDKAPRPIETLEDFIWFNTFNFRYDESRFAMVLKLMSRWNNTNLKMFDNVLGFFYTDDFQRWSIGRYEDQYDRNNFKKTIKLQMRKIMRKQFSSRGDDYINNKGIVESPIGLYYPNYVMLTDNFEIKRYV